MNGFIQTPRVGFSEYHYILHLLTNSAFLGVTVPINDMTKDEFNIVITEDLTSIAISEVTEDNEGEYTCWVTTPLGQMSSSATLTVEPPCK